jgi:DNA polymerase-1
MTWLLIDGNNWFARDFFASSDSASVNFLRRLEDLRSQVTHSRVVICWDARSSFRHELSEGYKAKRLSKPDGFYGNMTDLRNELATLIGVYSFHAEGFEADDLLATLVRNALDEGQRAVVFSSDRDLHQCLVAGSVSQVTQVSRLKPGQLAFSTMTADKLELEYSVKSWQWIDYRTMVGDSSDSITGCRGVGPKAAAEVLRACGTLERFFAEPFKPAIQPKQRQSLLAFRPEVELRRRLITLCESAPLPAMWLEGASL